MDLGSTATKVARLRKVGEGATLVGAEILPPVPLPDGLAQETEEVELPEVLDLPSALRAKYASICTTSPLAVIKG